MKAVKTHVRVIFFKPKLLFEIEIYLKYIEGDSGGSLFSEDKLNDKKKFISAGIVSYGMGCADKYFPG